MKEVKCYPVRNHNVKICPHNRDGKCNLFNKECDNVQGGKEEK